MSKNCAKWKYFNSNPMIYVECNQMHGSEVCIQEFWYCVPGLDIQPELSENDNPARKKAIAGCETLQVIWWVIYSIFSGIMIRTNGSVVKASRRQSGNCGSNPVGCWNSLQPLGHFAWHWACQCTDTPAFYIAALFIIIWISSVAISRWQGFNFNMNIRLTLFWSTWSRALGQDSCTCAGLAHWPDFSDCRA